MLFSDHMHDIDVSENNKVTLPKSQMKTHKSQTPDNTQQSSFSDYPKYAG
jgi:hypothetical protein